LGELSVDGISGHETRHGSITLKKNLRVDVEHSLNTAWGPNSRCLGNVVSCGIVIIIWSSEVGLGGSLLGRSREVVGGLLDTGLAGWDGSISTVGGRVDAVLETGWVVDGDVQLAVLAGLGDRDARSVGDFVVIENEGEGGSVVRDGGADASSWAAGATGGDLLYVDLSWVWASTS